MDDVKFQRAFARGGEAEAPAVGGSWRAGGAKGTE